MPSPDSHPSRPTTSPPNRPATAAPGSLFEVDDRPVPRFRCRVGHAWSPESLLDEQAIALEGALWMALRALEEKSALRRRMAATRGSRSIGARFADIARDAENAGATIRHLIARLGSTPAQTGDTAPAAHRPGDLPA